MRFISSSILGIIVTCGVAALGCSSSSDSGPSGTTDSGVQQDTGSGGTDTGSSGTDTGTAGDSSSDTPSEGGGGFALKIEDYLNWCNVAVNGGAVSTADPQNFGPFPAGTKVNLVGDTASSASFVWGYWRGTDGDTSGTHDTSKTTTVTITKDTVVQACCPLVSSPTTPCPNPT